VVELERPHLIVPEIEAIATDELERIDAAGLAEVIPTARAARLTMNREGIRRLAAEELGLERAQGQVESALKSRLDEGRTVSTAMYSCHPRCVARRLCAWRATR
jgi:formate-dependent phosphoribosylglycinamide formyltransferase (GAR transformylase)